jgi:hypothetical protein
MMFPTHILKGLVLVTPLLYIYPEISGLIIICATIGFTIPDIDILFGKHRKTLHFPVLGFFPYIFLTIVFLITSNLLALLVSVFFFGIHIHSVSDILGGSLEAEPWKKNDNRAVYNHIKSEWIRPLRIIQYDGSKRDLSMYFLLLIAFVFVTPFEIGSKKLLLPTIILSLIALSYTFLRKSVFSPVYMEENYPWIKRKFDRIIN